MATLTERIEAAQKALVNKKDSLLAITKQLEDTPDDETLLEQVDALSVDVEKATRNLDTLKKAENVLAERAKNEAPAIITHQGKPEDSKELWLKNAVCSFVSYVNRIPYAEAREQCYKNNKALEAITTKTAVPIATTFTAGWAA